MCLDSEGILVTRNLIRDKEVKIKKHGIMKYNFVKFNEFNDNQYFVSSEKFFKIFDLRNHQEIESIPEFKNTAEMVNDSNSFLITEKNSIKLYFNKEINKDGEYALAKSWKLNNISCIGMDNPRLKFPDIILLGTDVGDLYYSNLANTNNINN